MQAGKLNKVIQILTPTTTTNEFGEQVQSYKFKKETRASVDYAGGSREISNDEIVYSYNKDFKVRIYTDVLETDIIQYNNKKWRILSIEPIPEWREKRINTELINE